MKFLILSVLIISLSMILLPRVISSSIYEANQLLPLVGMILFAFSGIMGIYILYKEKRAGEIIVAAESKDPF